MFEISVSYKVCVEYDDTFSFDVFQPVIDVGQKGQVVEDDVVATKRGCVGGDT